MCKCLDRVNKKLAPDGLMLPTISMLNIENGKARETVYFLSERINSASRVKRRKVIPSFCPFCGIKVKAA